MQSAPNSRRLPGGGLLSAIQVGSKLIQIQTELNTYPDLHAGTTVYFDGRILLSEKGRLCPRQTDTNKLLADQHQGVVRKIRGKLQAKQTPTRTLSCDGEDDAFLKGFRAYRNGDYGRAIACWLALPADEQEEEVLGLMLAKARSRLTAKAPV